MKKSSLIFSAIYIFTTLLSSVLSSQVFAGVNEKFNSIEGLKRLNRSQSNNDFYQLVNFYQPQNNPLYCGVTTGVILLNATRSNAEISSQKENQVQSPNGELLQFHSYSQQSFLNDKTDKIKKREVLQMKVAAAVKNGEEFYDAGLSLDDFSKIMTKVYGFKIQKNYVEKVDEKSRAKFRADLKKYLADSKNFVVVNFDGKIVSNGTGGHISPLAAYDEVSDSVLVLDVALHKTQWYWVDVNKLFDALNTKDSDTYRGYLIIR